MYGSYSFLCIIQYCNLRVTIAHIQEQHWSLRCLNPSSNILIFSIRYSYANMPLILVLPLMIIFIAVNICGLHYQCCWFSNIDSHHVCIIGIVIDTYNAWKVNSMNVMFPIVKRISYVYGHRKYGKTGVKCSEKISTLGFSVIENFFINSIYSLSNNNSLISLNNLHPFWIRRSTICTKLVAWLTKQFLQFSLWTWLMRKNKLV